jgi:N6-adenosine-specific RNA methylase IME4
MMTDTDPNAIHQIHPGLSVQHASSGRHGRILGVTSGDPGQPRRWRVQVWARPDLGLPATVLRLTPKQVHGQFRLPLYRTILMDPPWLERGSGKAKRGADRHYPLASRREIRDAILDSGEWTPDPAASHLWCWVTNNYLADGLWLMEALGFRYVTNWPWVKGTREKRGRLGIGQYGRGCHELLLFGVMGKGYDACTVYPPGHPKEGKRRSDVRTDWMAPAPRITDPVTGKIVHSAKPVESYDLIEARSIGPRIEFFARQKRSGWDAWGNDPALEGA